MLSVLGAIAGLWGVETLRQQDPFARFTRRLAQSGLQEIELLLERPQITLRAGARAVATLEVDRIVVDRARITWRAENLRRAVFYDEQGKPIAQARAGAILYNQPARRIHLQGQPEFVYLRAPLVEKPVRVRMAWLTWDLRLRQLSIPARMQFEWEGGTGSAEQFVWDLARGETSLSNGVFRFRVALPDSPDPSPVRSTRRGPGWSGRHRVTCRSLILGMRHGRGPATPAGVDPALAGSGPVDPGRAGNRQPVLRRGES
jgi:hypothetical protein